jgi:hypothetical protein
LSRASWPGPVKLADSRDKAEPDALILDAVSGAGRNASATRTGRRWGYADKI